MAVWGGKEPHRSGFEHKLAIGLGPGMKRVNILPICKMTSSLEVKS